jgi:hypothetical protein
MPGVGALRPAPPYTGNLYLRNWKILKVRGTPSAELRGF